MPLDSVLTSPHRRTQPQSAFSPRSLKKHEHSQEDSFGSCSTLVERHRFLLTALALLAFLCTVYLYFAITIGAASDDHMCSGLLGAEKASCHLRQMAKGKLKLF